MRGQAALTRGRRVRRHGAALVVLALATTLMTATPGLAVVTTFTVNSTADPGTGSCDATECTLREAIAAANAVPGSDVIAFAIPGEGPHTIQPTSAYPAITDAVTIDGTSQAGYQGSPLIELDGSVAGGPWGLQVSSSGSLVKGLAINRWGIFLFGGGSNTIQDNYIGTDVTGMVGLGSFSEGIGMNGSPGNLIQFNVISGNGGSGITFFADSDGTEVVNNRIGVAADYVTPLGNGGNGLHMQTADNYVSGNIIAYNGGDGVWVTDPAPSNPSVGNTIDDNAIHSNGGLGIDLAPDGVNGNDQDDVDVGPNDRQNHPLIVAAEPSTGDVSGTATGEVDDALIVSVYLNGECDGSGHGEGEFLLGSVPVAPTGDWTLTVDQGSFGHDSILTATTTNAAGSTSEFSPCFTVPEQPPLNDDFVDADIISGASGADDNDVVNDFSGPGGNIGATAEQGEPAHADGTATNSVWWTWTAPSSGRYTFHTSGDCCSVGTDFDTVLAVYQGDSVDSLTPVTANRDRTPDEPTSAVTFDATMGNEYRIAIDGQDGATGFSASLVWGPTPGNDDLAAAFDLGDGPVALPGFSASEQGDTTLATHEAGEPQYLGGQHSVWFKLTPSTSGPVKVDAEDIVEFASTDFDATLGVYTGNSFETLTTVAQDDDNGTGLIPCLVFSAQAGTTYRIALDGYFGNRGNYALTASDATQNPGCADGGGAPANDAFVGAESIAGASGAFDNPGGNQLASEEAGEPDHAGDPGGSSVWFRWIAPTTGRYTFHTAGELGTCEGDCVQPVPASDFDTLLAVYTESSPGMGVNGLVPVAANDDAGPGQPHSFVSFSALSGNEYLIALDGKGGAQGFTASLTWGPTPDNDDIAGATSLSGAEGTTPGDTSFATREPGEPSIHSGSHSLWYSFSPSVSGPVMFTTNGSDATGLPFDTTLGIYRGTSFATQVVVAQDDDAGIGLNSCMVFDATAGQTYLIAVDGYGEQRGTFVLNRSATNLVCDPTAPPDQPGLGENDTAGGNAAPGETISTDGSGDGATPEDPVESAVTHPEGGNISIEETQSDQQLEGNYSTLGQQVNVTAPPATAEAPIVIVLRIDASLIPAGEDETTVEVFRNGVTVPACTDAASTAAAPDPCVARRQRLDDGDISLTVYTSQASAWNAGLRPPRQIGGPDDNDDPPANAPTPTPSPSPSASPSASTTATATGAPTATASVPPVTTSPTSPVDTSAPRAEGGADRDAFSPNGDGRGDEVTIEAAFDEEASWELVISPAGEPRHGSSHGSFSEAGRGRAARVTWTGFTDTGRAPDGSYRWQLIAVDEAGNTSDPLTGLVKVDRAKPVTRVKVTPAGYFEQGDEVTIKVTVDEGARVRVSLDKRRSPVARLKPKSIGQAGTLTFTWRGRDKKGFVASRHYVIEVRAKDAAGNVVVDRSQSIVFMRRP